MSIGVSDYLDATAFVKIPSENAKEDALHGQQLFLEVCEVLDTLAEKLTALRKVASFAPDGQPIIARVRVPQVLNVSRKLTQPKLGSRVELRVHGAGPLREQGDMSTTMVVPSAKQGAAALIVDAQAEGEMVITGRLRPRFYPEHDILVTRSLDKLSKILTEDELSWLKLPGAAVTGPTEQTKGLKWREPWVAKDDANDLELKKRSVCD